MTNPGQEPISGTDMPVRVLCLIKGLGPGGAERLVVASARHRSADVSMRVAYVLAHKTALVPDLEALKVPVECIGTSVRAFDLRWVVRLRRRLLNDSTDVVHVHSPVAAAAVRLAVRTLTSARRPAVVTTEHNVWASHARLTRFASRLTGRADDATFAVSQAVRDSMPRRLRTRTDVVRYGVDLAIVRAANSNRNSVRNELGVTDDRTLIVTVANLRSTKGYPDLLAAARRVIDIDPSVDFISVGQGPMEKELLDLHRRLDLGDRFRFLGFRRDATSVIAAGDIFCLASYHEGLPIAIIEAMALGRAIVATDVGGVSEIVESGLSGALVAAHNPAALATALVELAADPKRRDALGASAHLAADSFGVDTAIHAVEATYRELVRTRRR